MENCKAQSEARNQSAMKRLGPVATEGALPPSRKAHALAQPLWRENIAIVHGGQSDTAIFDDMYKYNVALGEWSRVVYENSEHPQARIMHTMTAYRPGQFLLFGGLVAHNTELHDMNDLWTFDLRDRVWEKIAPAGDVPSPRAGHSAVFGVGGDGVAGLFVHGGADEEDGVVYRFDIRDRLWEKIYEPRTISTRGSGEAPKLPCARETAAACWVQGKKCMFISGGSKKTNDMYLSDMWVFCYEHKRWKWRALTDDSVITARIGQSVIVLPSVSPRLLLWGGLSYRDSQQIFSSEFSIVHLDEQYLEIFNASEYDGKESNGRLLHTMFMANERLYVFGGISASTATGAESADVLHKVELVDGMDHYQLTDEVLYGVTDEGSSCAEIATGKVQRAVDGSCLLAMVLHGRIYLSNLPSSNFGGKRATKEVSTVSKEQSETRNHVAGTVVAPCRTMAVVLDPTNASAFGIGKPRSSSIALSNILPYCDKKTNGTNFDGLPSQGVEMYSSMIKRNNTGANCEAVEITAPPSGSVNLEGQPAAQHAIAKPRTIARQQGQPLSCKSSAPLSTTSVQKANESARTWSSQLQGALAKPGDQRPKRPRLDQDVNMASTTAIPAVRRGVVQVSFPNPVPREPNRSVAGASTTHSGQIQGHHLKNPHSATVGSVCGSSSRTSFQGQGNILPSEITSSPTLHQSSLLMAAQTLQGQKLSKQQQAYISRQISNAKVQSEPQSRNVNMQNLPQSNASGLLLQRQVNNGMTPLQAHAQAQVRTQSQSHATVDNRALALAQAQRAQQIQKHSQTPAQSRALTKTRMQQGFVNPQVHPVSRIEHSNSHGTANSEHRTHIMSAAPQFTQVQRQAPSEAQTQARAQPHVAAPYGAQTKARALTEARLKAQASIEAQASLQAQVQAAQAAETLKQAQALAQAHAKQAQVLSQCAEVVAQRAQVEAQARAKAEAEARAQARAQALVEAREQALAEADARAQPLYRVNIHSQLHARSRSLSRSHIIQQQLGHGNQQRQQPIVHNSVPNAPQQQVRADSGGDVNGAAIERQNAAEQSKQSEKHAHQSYTSAQARITVRQSSDLVINGSSDATKHIEEEVDDLEPLSLPAPDEATPATVTNRAPPTQTEKEVALSAVVIADDEDEDELEELAPANEAETMTR